MAKEIVEAVKAAEEKALSIREDALNEAAEIAQKAKKHASSLIAEAKANAETKAAEIADEATKKADALLNADFEDDKFTSLKSDIASKSKDVAKKLIELI